MNRRAVPLLAALVALLAVVASPAAAQEPSATLPDIEDEVMCPICGTALNLSESPQADAQREFIRRRIDEGLNKEEIKDALVAEYGPEVLATPEASGFDLAAWLIPGLAITLAAVALIVGILRWRSGDRRQPPAAAAAIDPEAARRLDADMRRYDV